MNLHNNLRKHIPYWILVMSSYSIFRYYGFADSVQMPKPNISEVPLPFVQILGIFALLGIGLGVFYACVDFFFEKYVSKRLGIGIRQFLRVLSYFLSTVFIISMITFVASNMLDLGIDIYFGWWVREKQFWAIMYYIVLCSFVLYFISSTTERFGKGKYLKMLFGRYRFPKEERVVFMFLDLKDSTTIAESLGHYKYSELLQECFFDLNELVPQYNAQIYQYVGDEAVVYWSYEKGLENNNCVNLFFAFENLRKEKKESYLKKYGIHPAFKAGIHGGKLIAVEVGHVKRELAYHGDVINTTARIQAECNNQNESLLISEELLMAMRKEFRPESKFVGNILLKGKKQGVNIHSIDG
nr:adenylate/guanylate cyclase domain-containing protein [Allomuricauda sp.]